ncbi:fatty acyl-CoA reductase wat-like [Musca vetustissima]|uniref:fatty acyl-CoA reductase wat-like n=1 Tax=Musca vetustissima TaxID=27455 RepID=UPI002AB642CC|nr:fatty acyl-CoA reductase wat-like [Musca vetustissima]
MSTDIQRFFRNKTIFITGGSGFLGRVLLEKILSCTEVKCIYVLLRRKAGQEITDRFNNILKSPLFDKLHTLRSNILDQIRVIEGDCSLENLGISNDDYRELIENVEVILHCAATVNFSENLSVATQINVQATMDVIRMAKEMQKLKSFVHVSTAFVHCDTIHTEERFNSEHLCVNSEDLLNIKKSLKSDTFDSLTSNLIGKPTKAVTEGLIKQEESSLPLCIFRPGIIISTVEEPIPGWIDTIQGAAGATYSFLIGVLRIINVAYKTKAPLVPVDYCANMIMAATWHTASNHKSRRTSEPTIYNFVPDETNTINMVRLNRKITRLTAALKHFINNDFTYETTNTRHLWKSLSLEDQKIFNFDMASLKWNDYLLRYANGLRLYIAKENEKSISSAKRTLNRFNILNIVVHLIVFIGLLWTLKSIILS